MKTHPIHAAKRGFTLMELMVAMAITTVIVTVLVTVTSIALDTWNRSRAELRASRQAKTMIDTLAKDFESLVVRKGNRNEWLSAIQPQGTVGDKIHSTNAAQLIFYTAVTDRYFGDIGPGSTKDNGGDVSCVGYKLDYKDPLNVGGGNRFETFVLNRFLLDPDKTFTDMLGKENLETSFASYSSDLSDPENFVCENVFQFTITFHVQVSQVTNGTQTLVTVPVTVGSTNANNVTSSFKILGTGLETNYAGGLVTADELKAGRISAMEISLTVISDFGIDQLRQRTFTPTQQADFLAQNSFQFSKLVQLPTM